MKKGYTKQEKKTITKVVRNEIRLSPTNLSKAFANAADKLEGKGIKIKKSTITAYYYTKDNFLYRGGENLGVCFSIISDRRVSGNCKNVLEGANNNIAVVTPRNRYLTIKKLAKHHKLYFKH